MKIELDEQEMWLIIDQLINALDSSDVGMPGCKTLAPDEYKQTQDLVEKLEAEVTITHGSRYRDAD